MPLVKLERDQFGILEVSVFAGIANQHPNLLRSKREPCSSFGFQPKRLSDRRIDQLLRRVRLELLRTVESDRMSMVIATVAMGRGFAITSPALLIDGIAEGMEFDIERPQVAGLHREITLVGRERELTELAELLSRAFANVQYDSIQTSMPLLPRDSIRAMHPRNHQK